MKLLEAIIEANHRAVTGDSKAGLHPADYEDELPIVALSCIDVRLNPLLPEVLGVSEEHFIWLRNAGNIVTGPLSSTMRSLALACAIKGGRQILVIGHTDCVVGRTTTAELIERFRQEGIERQQLPDNLNEFFGTFSSERQNVIRGTDLVRQSPIIGPRVPVHGLIVDIETGKLEWLVNGYQVLEMAGAQPNRAAQTAELFKAVPDFKIGEINFPATQIGEFAVPAASEPSPERAPVAPPAPSAPPGPQVRPLPSVHRPSPPSPPPPLPPRIPMPPPLRPKAQLRKGWK